MAKFRHRKAPTVREVAAAVLPMAACGYLVFACYLVGCFYRGRCAPPSAGAEGEAEGTEDEALPAVSVLKPVHGLDPGAYANYESFCRQDYPEYEILFACDRPDDAAVPLVRRLQAEFAQVDITLLTEAPQVAANPKINSLAAMTARAAHPVLVASDSDIRVTPDYLRHVVAPLRADATGMVTCCYRGVASGGWTAGLEALHMGVTFLPEVIVARRYLDMGFALGATIALRKADLQAMGGWEAAGSYLAEDNRLGMLVAGSGKRVVLSSHLVDSQLGRPGFVEEWRREVRWARTNRVSRPWEYPGIVLTFAVPLAAAALLAGGRGRLLRWVLATALAVRWLTAWLVTGFTDNRPLRRWLPWLPVRDLLSGVQWAVGMAGRRVEWRGRVFRVSRDGRLLPPSSTE